MAQNNPSMYQTPSITRAGTLISELNIISVKRLQELQKKYDFTSMMLITERQRNGAIPLTVENVENKMYYHWEQIGRYMDYFSVNADVTVSNGADATVTLNAGSHSIAGTRSLPEIGMIFKNDRTGVETRVVAVNKGTAGAHTVQLHPVVTGTNASVLAGDEILNRGFKYVGEASDYTTTLVMRKGKYINYVSQLRKDAKMTDLAQMEATDIVVNGQNRYMYIQKDEFNKQIIFERELMALDSNLTDNLGYAESGTAGMLQLIRANSPTYNYSGAFSILGTFASIDRLLDNLGAPGEYDLWSDNNQAQEINTAIINEFPNGAIQYSQENLRTQFKSIQPFTRKFNFVRYAALSNAMMYGSSGSGSFSNLGILAPRSTTYMDGDVKVNDVPRIVMRYMEYVKGEKWFSWETGPKSPNGKTTKLEDVYSTIGHFGLELFGPEQFLLIQKS